MSFRSDVGWRRRHEASASLVWEDMDDDIVEVGGGPPTLARGHPSARRS